MSASGLGRAGLAGQQARVDAFAAEGGLPALLSRRVEQYGRAADGRIPTMAGHFLFELAAVPAGIAKRDQPARRAAARGDRLEHVEGPGQRVIAVGANDGDGVLAAPVLAVEDEAAARLDRPAV